MTQYSGKSRVTDYELREAVNKLSEEERENLIQKLEVSHSVFKNWLEEKYKLVNSKKRNKLIHLLGV